MTLTRFQRPIPYIDGNTCRLKKKKRMYFPINEWNTETRLFPVDPQLLQVKADEPKGSPLREVCTLEGRGLAFSRVMGKQVAHSACSGGERERESYLCEYEGDWAGSSG